MLKTSDAGDDQPKSIVAVQNHLLPIEFVEDSDEQELVELITVWLQVRSRERSMQYPRNVSAADWLDPEYRRTEAFFHLMDHVIFDAISDLGTYVINFFNKDVDVRRGHRIADAICAEIAEQFHGDMPDYERKMVDLMRNATTALQQTENSGSENVMDFFWTHVKKKEYAARWYCLSPSGFCTENEIGIVYMYVYMNEPGLSWRDLFRPATWTDCQIKLSAIGVKIDWTKWIKEGRQVIFDGLKDNGRRGFAWYRDEWIKRSAVGA